MLSYQTDWEIIVLRKQYRKLTQSYDLDKPIWIGDTRCQLHPKKLFDGVLEIYLPAQFGSISEEAAKWKYPSMNRPQIIMTNEDMTVDFTLSHVGQAAQPMTAHAVWEEIDRIFPRNVLYETGSFNTGGLEIIWLEYKSFSLSLEVYNILFAIMPNAAGAIIGTFTCPFTSYDIWKPCVLQIIKTIKVQESTDAA